MDKIHNLVLTFLIFPKMYNNNTLRKMVKLNQQIILLL